MTFDEFLLQAEKAIVSKARSPEHVEEMVASFDTSMVEGGSTYDVRQTFFQKLLHNVGVQRHDINDEGHRPGPAGDALRAVLDGAIGAIQSKLEELQG